MKYIKLPMQIINWLGVHNWKFCGRVQRCGIKLILVEGGCEKLRGTYQISKLWSGNGINTETESAPNSFQLQLLMQNVDVRIGFVTSRVFKYTI